MNLLSSLHLRRRVLGTVAAALLGAQAIATWSIVVVDRATGEVCVASATCIADSFLKPRVAIIVIGEGAGAGQAFNNPVTNEFIGQSLDDGLSPEEILAQLLPGHTRQYGIVNFDDPPVTHAGDEVGQARPGVTGEAGSLVYAIQGNVLAGNEVVYQAEQTLLQAEGDLGQRVMAAMETARAYGGDGRCSCSNSNPPSCGSPPPSFSHSAYTAFIVVARIGDKPGTNYHNGDYYLDKRFVGNQGTIDPVVGLQTRYDQWRANRIGGVDHILTEVLPSAQRLVADGTSTMAVTVRLRDIDGNPLALGGQTIYVRGIGGPQPASVEGVVDNGDGTHTVTLRAGRTPGHCRWRLVVDAGAPRTLHPPLEIDVDPLAPLHVGFDSVSASAGADVPVVTNAGMAQAGRPYLVLASAAGTSPGTPFNGQILPLNQDRILRRTLHHPGPPLFPGSAGQLDAFGRAEATMQLRAHTLMPFVGGRLDFATVLFGTPDEFTDPVGFEILP